MKLKLGIAFICIAFLIILWNISEFSKVDVSLASLLSTEASDVEANYTYTESAEPGGEISVTSILQNNDRFPASFNITLYVREQLGRVITQESLSGSVSPHQSQTTSLSLLIPSRTQPGDYLLEGSLKFGKKEFVLGPVNVSIKSLVKIADVISLPRPTQETITRYYEWEYGRSKWNWNLTIPGSLYGYYKNKPRPPTGDYSVYVTDPYDDQYIGKLVEAIDRVAIKEGLAEHEKINLAIAFVQSLPYTPDNVTTKFDEYPRYPIETLADNGGDCEDASILTAALLSNMGYKVILISPPEHMAVGIHIEGAYGSYYEIEGRKYFYLETTGKGWKIGEIPEEYRGAEVKIYQLIPKPVLTHKWTALQRGYVLTLNVTVKNVGTAAANNVKVYAAFDAGEGHVYNPKESKSFNLNADAEAEITLYLDVPREKHTRLIVKILSNIYLMDTSYSEWFQT